MNSVYRTAEQYANNRLFTISNGNSRIKLGGKEIRQEMVNASVFGELSAMERIMAEIIDDKTLTRDDIEAKLHIAIVELYNYIRNKFGDKAYQIKLEDYLSLRGYYGKETMGSQVVKQ